MKPSPTLSPTQLDLVSLSGFVISAASSLPLTCSARKSDGIHWITALLIFCIFLAGMAVSLKANDALKNGIANRQWPADQVEPLRSRLQSPLFGAFLGLLLIVYALLWIIYPKYRAIGLAGFLLMQTLSQLRYAVTRQRSQSSNLNAGLRNLSPIHSDQWGHR